jgi:hypothetical protein
MQNMMDNVQVETLLCVPSQGTNVGSPFLASFARSESAPQIVATTLEDGEIKLDPPAQFSRGNTIRRTPHLRSQIMSRPRSDAQVCQDCQRNGVVTKTRTPAISKRDYNFHLGLILHEESIRSKTCKNLQVQGTDDVCNDHAD